MEQHMHKPTGNPLLDELSGRIGGVTMALPSLGAFYGPDVMRSDPSSVEVLPISVIDEINFRDPFKIVSGAAVREMVARACPAVARPELLCKVDVDAILVASRIASYGSNLEITLRCQNRMAVKRDADGAESVGPCEEPVELKVDLNRVLAQFQPIGQPDEWQVKLPNGQVVQLVPIPYASVLRGMIEVADQAKEAKRLELEKRDRDIDALSRLQESSMDKAAKFQVSLLIDSIAFVRTNAGQRISDVRQITEWLRSVPTTWVLQVNDLLNAKTAAIDKYGMASFTCPACSFKNDVPVNMDMTSFFSQGSRRQQR